MELNYDICSKITSYVYKPHYELLDWIPLHKLELNELKYNPHAIDLLEQNYLDKINWYVLSYNPKAISILAKNQDKINWDMLSYNTNAIELFRNGG